MKQQAIKSRRLLALALSLCLLLTLLPGTALSVLAAAPSYQDGVYTGAGTGRNGEIVLSVTLTDGVITAVEELSQQETPRYWEQAKTLLSAIVEANSPEVDGVSGATLSSNGIKEAVRNALAQADASIPGSGTEADPYVIRSAVQLRAFAAHVDAGEADWVNAWVELGADIDLSGADFDPIGVEGKNTTASLAGKFFGGVFDGKGYTVSNLTIHGAYTAEANLGLFSSLAPTALVRNVNLENVSIQAAQTGSFKHIRAGGIAGDTCRVANSTDPRAAVVDGCSVTGSILVSNVDGQAFAGGILGRAFTKSAILNCVADGSFTAQAEGGWNAAYAGAIAGMTGNDTVLVNCAAFGSVQAANPSSGSADAYAGGLAGMLSSRVWNCYSLCDVTLTQKTDVAKRFLGALAGQLSGSAYAGDHNYYADELRLTLCDETGNEEAVALRPWSEDDLLGAATAEAPLPRAQMGEASFAELLNASCAAVTATLDETALALRTWERKAGRVLPTGPVWTDEITGSGAADDPYVIRTAKQLRDFAAHVDEGSEIWTEAYVELGADIDLAGQEFDPIGAEGKNTDKSLAGKFFGGVFDGKNHTISNLTLSGSYATEANVGLFSSLAPTALVKNVKLTGVNINVSQTGSFAHLRAGGVAGDTCRVANSSDPRAAVVDGCTVSGAVSVHAADGQGFAGGILGRTFTKAAVVNCVSDVTVQAVTEGSWNAAYAGGVTGMNGNSTVLANNVSFGTQRAENLSGSNDAYAGGLTGMMGGALYSSYAVGDVTIAQKAGVAKQFIGALAGQLTGSGSGNYYTDEAVLTVLDDAAAETRIEARPWSADDCFGSATAEAPLSRAALATEDFAATLTAAAEKATAELKEDALQLLPWKLEEGRVIPAEGSQPEEPAVFASGSGTEEDPWIILTKEQMYAFAASLTATEDYSGKYVALGADIDLSGRDWTPVGGSAWCFNGDFDGRGYTLSGLTEGSPESPRTLDAESAHIGLFGWLNEHAHIHDLTLADVAIYTHASGTAYVGGVAGRISGSDTEGDYHGAVIDHVAVTGVMEHTTDKGTFFMGGVGGHVFKGAIVNTWTNVRMKGVELSGQLAEVGGIVGLLNRGLVANCYTLGSVVGSGYRDTQYDIEGMACVGGVAAVNGGYITNCYSQGDVTALEYSIDTGVLAGWVTGIAKVYNCYYNEAAQMTIDGRSVDPVDPFGETVAGGVSDEYGFSFPGSLVDHILPYTPGAEQAAQVAAGLNASFAAFPIDMMTIYGLPADCLRTWTVEGDRAVLGDSFATAVYEQPQIEKDLEEEPEPSLLDGVWYGRSEDKSTVVAITVVEGQIVETQVVSGEQSGEHYDYALSRAKFKATYGDFTDYSQADFSGFSGSGTEADPYLIETPAQLRYLAEAIDEDVDFYDLWFRQTADLDLSDAEWFPIGWGIFADADGDGFGQDLVALYPFRGHYEGDGHSITGLHAGTEEEPFSGNWMGLFGIIQGDYTTNEIPSEELRLATIRNLRVEDVSFRTENRWRSYIGGLVGNAQGGFEIDHCSVTGEIHANSTEDFAFAGGLSGSLMYGLVRDTWTDVEAWSWSGKNYSYAAGMSAVTNRSTIVNCYTLGGVHADADLTNRAEAGGFIALDGGVCINCYARGSVEIVSKYSMYLGGFVGMAASASEHRLCYYNHDADQSIAGKPVAEKQYAGKFVNESAEAFSQSQTEAFMRSEGFADLLNENRGKLSQVLAEVREALGADENGSSRYHSVYYHGDGSDLREWNLNRGTVGLEAPFRFADVQDPDKYYFEPVYWAYNHSPQITGGVDETHFGPKQNATRAQVVTFLWALAGKPEPSATETAFVDVKPTAYYYKAVLWAVERGISSGATPTTFNPKGLCTRREFVTFLYAYAGKPEVEPTELPFTDVEQGKWYTAAITWAWQNGIVSGTSATTFSPKATCTRAQIVTMLYAFAK